MNELIQKFAEQADLFADSKLQMKGEYHPDWHDIRDEKFAMLIVQECIEQAHCVADSRGVNADMIYGADTAAARIAKHFGVNNETK
jgi:hypothetical protein